MNAITDRRTAMHDALAEVFVAPIGGLAFSGRVHRTEPAKLAAPCVYIDASAGRSATSKGGAALYLTTYPVVVVYDGAQQAQIDGVEELVCRVMDAVGAVDRAEVTGHAPITLDVQRIDPTSKLRAVAVSVDVPILTRTFCRPTLT